MLEAKREPIKRGFIREVRFYECLAETEDIEAGSDLGDVRFVPRKDAIDFISEKVRNYLPKEIFDYLNR